MAFIDSLPPLVGIIVICFLVVLAILWFFLPFAIFGIDSKMKELLRETRKTNELLSRK